MRPLHVPVAFTLLLSSASVASAAGTPQKTYEHEVDCTSHVMALQVAGMREGGKAAADAPKLDVAVQRMRAKAVAAGAAVGTSAEQVGVQIDQGRDRLVRTLDQRDAVKLKQARQEIGLTAISCLLDEAKSAIDARKAETTRPGGG